MDRDEIELPPLPPFGIAPIADEQTVRDYGRDCYMAGLAAACAVAESGDAWTAATERARRERDDAVRAQASLRLEIESMRSSDWYKDAERYRWLRNSSPPHLCVRRWQRITPAGTPQPESSVRGNELDSAIDAARQAVLG